MMHRIKTLTTEPDNDLETGDRRPWASLGLQAGECGSGCERWPGCGSSLHDSFGEAHSSTCGGLALEEHVGARPGAYDLARCRARGRIVILVAVPGGLIAPARLSAPGSRRPAARYPSRLFALTARLSAERAEAD